MELHRGGTVQVGAWFEIGVELGQRAFDHPLAFESPLESRAALRPVADAEEDDAHVGEFSASARAVPRDSDHAPDPPAARHPGERAAPSKSTAIANRRMPDMRDRRSDERQMFGYVGGALEIDMARERSDAHETLRDLDTG